MLPEKRREGRRVRKHRRMRAAFADFAREVLGKDLHPWQIDLAMGWDRG